MSFLNQNEKIELTGSDKPYVQKRILDKHGIRYVEHSSGELAVTWYYVDHPYGNKSKASNESTTTDFSAIM